MGLVFLSLFFSAARAATTDLGEEFPSVLLIVLEPSDARLSSFTISWIDF